jgi:hypothetical protein
MNVTEWKPTEGCSACKQAEKIMGKMTRISMQGHGLAKNKIMELEQQNSELLEAMKGLELYARDLLLLIDGGKAEMNFNLPKEITNAQAAIAKAKRTKA